MKILGLCLFFAALSLVSKYRLVILLWRKAIRLVLLGNNIVDNALIILIYSALLLLLLTLLIWGKRIVLLFLAK